MVEELSNLLNWVINSSDFPIIKSPNYFNLLNASRAQSRFLRNSCLRSTYARQPRGCRFPGSSGGHATGPAQRTRSRSDCISGEKSRFAIGFGCRTAPRHQEQRRSSARNSLASRLMPSSWWDTAASFRNGCSTFRHSAISTCTLRCCRNIAARRRFSGRLRAEKSSPVLLR